VTAEEKALLAAEADKRALSTSTNASSAAELLDRQQRLVALINGLRTSIAQTNATELVERKTSRDGLQGALLETLSEYETLSCNDPPSFGSRIHFVHNADERRYEWLCPQNSHVYHLKDADAVGAGLNTQLRGVSGHWSRVEALPVWDKSTASFLGSDSTWYDPVRGHHCFVDYERTGWTFSKGGPWVRNRLSLQTHHALIQRDDDIETVVMHIEAVFGLRRGEFKLSETRMADFSKHEIVVGHERGLVRTVCVGCASPNHWREGRGVDADGFTLVENTNERSARARSTRERAEKSGGGWSQEAFALATGSHGARGSALLDHFDDVRFFTMRAGGINPIAVRFGSDAHDPSWENPIVRFREAWFLQSPCNLLHDGVSHTWVILRTPFHIGITREALLDEILITNPTGVLSKNVERYWGYDPSDANPRCNVTTISYRDRSGQIPPPPGERPLESKRQRTLANPRQSNAEDDFNQRRLEARRLRNLANQRPGRGGVGEDDRFVRAPLVTKSVVDVKRLFADRTTLFFKWVHTPNNFYWDDVEQRMCVFAFTPDMAIVERGGGKRHLVQQLAVYYVDHLFLGKEQQRYIHELDVFRKLRKQTLGAWLEAEKGHPMPAAIQARIEDETETGKGFGDRLCSDVQAHFAQIVSRMRGTAAEPYYELVRRNFVHPHGNIADAAQGAGPSCANDAVRMMAQRQLPVRRLFWRLFEAKFGISYFRFLTDVEARAQVLSFAPDLMGPANELNFNSTFAATFIDDWNKRTDRTVPFKQFFAGFSGMGGCKPPRNRPPPEFPHAPDPPPADDNTLEDWYWENADVLPSLRG
jgi:hypothetical protein